MAALATPSSRHSRGRIRFNFQPWAIAPLMSSGGKARAKEGTDSATKCLTAIRLPLAFDHAVKTENENNG
jgi:hypothetical protein